MARQIEKEFLTAIRKSFERIGVYSYKIPDTIPSQDMRFTTKRPFDMVCCKDGEFIAIEAKASNKYEAFGYRFLSNGQKENLEMVINSGGLALVFYNVRIKSRVKKDRVNNLYIFSFNELKNLGRSYTKKEILEMVPIVEKKGLYNLEGI